MSEIAIRMRHERPLGFSESCACWIGASDLGLWGRGLVFGVSALHTTPYSPHPHPSPYTLHPSQSLALAASGLRVQGLWFGLWCFSESCACWFGAPGSGLRVRGLVCGVSALHTTPYSPHPHPSPYTLHPSQSLALAGSGLRVQGLGFGVWCLVFGLYTLHPTHDALHPTPYTLHPTTCTLHPTPLTSKLRHTWTSSGDLGTSERPGVSFRMRIAHVTTCRGRWMLGYLEEGTHGKREFCIDDLLVRIHSIIEMT